MFRELRKNSEIHTSHELSAPSFPKKDVRVSSFDSVFAFSSKIEMRFGNKGGV